MSVQRTEDYVAIGCARLAEQSLHVAINRQIPRLDVGRNALTLQRVASHKDATIIFYHSASVAIYIMQRQHHANSHILAHLGCRLGSLRFGSTWRFGERNKDGVTLFQLIPLGFHHGVSLDKLRKRNTIFARNAKQGIFLLCLIYVLPFIHLGTGSKHQKQSCH